MQLYLIPIIASLITAIVSGMVAFRISTRINSGRIETSAASELWEESRSIRKTLKEQNSALIVELESSRTARLALSTDIEHLKTELTAAEGDARRCDIKIAALENENEMLRGSNLALTRRMNDLETKAASMVRTAVVIPEGAQIVPGNGG